MNISELLSLPRDMNPGPVNPSLEGFAAEPILRRSWRPWPLCSRPPYDAVVSDRRISCSQCLGPNRSALCAVRGFSPGQFCGSAPHNSAYLWTTHIFSDPRAPLRPEHAFAV